MQTVERERNEGVAGTPWHLTFKRWMGNAKREGSMAHDNETPLNGRTNEKEAEKERGEKRKENRREETRYDKTRDVLKSSKKED